MSSIDTALYTRLTGFAGLRALIATRVYPPPTPQNGPYPLVTLTLISAVRIYAMGDQTPLVDSRWQIDVWASSSETARAVAEQVRLALSHYHGTSDTVVIDLVLMENEQKFYDSEAELHRVIQDYIVSYRETQPS